MTQSARRSHIFVVRTWTEETSGQLHELRGMVRDSHSGETRYFHCWKELVAFVRTLVEADEKRDCHP
jgi:hypothetical protein